MRATRREAFTLVELLVVVGIIAVLAGILLPSINKAYRSAQRTAQASTLQSIATALEAYRQDWKDYPRVRMVPLPYVRVDYSAARSSPDQKERPNPQTGAEVLCFALMGMADAVESETPPPNYMMKADGANGPGFRARAGSKAYPPYLAPDQFKTGMREASGKPETDQKYVLHFNILDRNNMPILYFPASPTKPNVTVGTGIAAAQPYVASTYVDAGINSESSRYDADDNLIWFFDKPFDVMADSTQFATGKVKALKRIRALLGDRHNTVAGPTAPPFTPDGVVQVYENAIDLPFLLWSSGPDERFGPDTNDFTDGPDLTDSDLNYIDNSDDVTNFMR